ncbi:hypothetical protein VPHK24_0097 [Vibrio phage K24]|nr:hypothetical protein SIPHO058v2_p0078 [Vibrio phage 14E30.2]
MENKVGRPHALGKYTPEEVAAKSIELGSFIKAAKHYGVTAATVGKYVGSIHCFGVDPKHVKEIRAMAHTHTKEAIGELLGYTTRQICDTGRKYGFSFPSARKPRKNSELSYYEMHNMDEIVKQYPSAQACAKAHGVDVRTINKHILLCKKDKEREAAHSNNKND